MMTQWNVVFAARMLDEKVAKEMLGLGRPLHGGTGQPYPESWDPEMLRGSERREGSMRTSRGNKGGRGWSFRSLFAR